MEAIDKQIAELEEKKSKLLAERGRLETITRGEVVKMMDDFRNEISELVDNLRLKMNTVQIKNSADYMFTTGGLCMAPITTGDK